MARKPPTLGGLLASYFATPAANGGYMAKEARSNRSALRQALVMAAPLGIDVERDNISEYWVTHPSFDGEADAQGRRDPCAGGHYCTSGREVLQCAQSYAEFFAANP
jgi:hypothetical protein